jgi:tetratricopeptide (TPR) repeat protein
MNIAATHAAGVNLKGERAMKTTLLSQYTIRWARVGLLALFLTVVQVAVTQLTVDVGLRSSGTAFAQEEEKKQQETRRTPALRNKVYEQLAEAQTFIESKQYGEALEILNDMEAQKGKRALNSYELANLYNLFAFVYYSQEDYANALRSYENVVSQSDIPLAMEINTRYTIAQLYFVMEDWQRGIDALNGWFKVAETPSAQAYILLGQGYYQMKDYDNALRNTLVAISMYKEKGKVPKEQWYSLMRFLYFEKNDIANTLATLEEMIVYYPKAQTWVQLSHMYGEAKDEKRQLAAMETAYLQEFLTKDREQVTMAYLYLNAEVPYKAAKVLDQGIKNESVEPSAKTLEILGNAWRQAQEVEKSIPVLEQAAAKSDDGDLYCRLGSVYLDNDDFKKAAEVNSKGLAKGGVKRPDQCHLVKGMALFNLKQYSAARKAFNAAGKDERSVKYAQQWLKYMDNEIARQKKLDEGMDVASL